MIVQCPNISSGEFGVWVGPTETIFRSDFLMPHLHLCLSLFLFSLHLIGPSLHLGIEPRRPDVFTLAAAEEADQEGDDNDSPHHRHGDDQRLKVHPAASPACIVEGADGVLGEDGADWVRDTHLSLLTPQALHNH